MQITYAELASFIARVHGVDPSKMVALQGRLKHFQRLSWPPGTRGGKGSRIQYGVGQTLLLALGFQMLEIGITPERITQLLSFSGASLSEGFRQCLDEYHSEPDHVFFAFRPDALNSLRLPKGEEEPAARNGWSMVVSRSILVETELKDQLLIGAPGVALINLSNLFNVYVDHFIGSGLGDPQNLKQPLDSWVELELELRKKRAGRLYTKGSPNADDPQA